MKLDGLTLTYQHPGGDAYCLRFKKQALTWKCLAGIGEGESGGGHYDAAAVGPDTLFVGWSERTGEAVSLVANLGRETVHVQYTYGAERHLLHAQLLSVNPHIAVEP